VPTTGEVGFPDVANIATMQRVVLAPAGTPPERLAKLRDAFAKLAQDKTYMTLLKKLGENNEYMDAEKYTQMRLNQDKAYAKLVKDLTN
jgi:tripartite-type tricarboxylate transporter receptor subunit TctC